MRDVIVFCLGLLAGLGISVAVLFVVKRHVQAKVMRELSDEAGIEPVPGETLEEFSVRSAGPRAERQLEKKWGVVRAAGESWDAYTERVAQHQHEKKQVEHGMPVIIGPRGQA